MTIFIWIWIAIIALITIGGVWDDYSENHPLDEIIIGFITGVICVICVLAFESNTIAAILGKWLILISIFAFFSFVRMIIVDIKNLIPDPELSLRENKAIEVFSIIFVSIIYGSAIFVGFYEGISVW